MESDGSKISTMGNHGQALRPFKFRARAPAFTPGAPQHEVLPKFHVLNPAAQSFIPRSPKAIKQGKIPSSNDSCSPHSSTTAVLNVTAIVFVPGNGLDPLDRSLISLTLPKPAHTEMDEEQHALPLPRSRLAVETGIFMRKPAPQKMKLAPSKFPVPGSAPCYVPASEPYYNGAVEGKRQAFVLSQKESRVLQCNWKSNYVYANGEEMSDNEDMSEEALEAERATAPSAVHHFNWLGNPVFEKSSTAPALSLTVIMSLLRPRGLTFGHNNKSLYRSTLFNNALTWIDPVYYFGDDPDTVSKYTGTELQEKVTGSVIKVYSRHGYWYDNEWEIYSDDEDLPEHDKLNEFEYDEEDVVLNGWYENCGVPIVRSFAGHDSTINEINHLQKQSDILDRLGLERVKSPLHQCTSSDDFESPWISARQQETDALDKLSNWADESDFLQDTAPIDYAEMKRLIQISVDGNQTREYEQCTSPSEDGSIVSPLDSNTPGTPVGPDDASDTQILSPMLASEQDVDDCLQSYLASHEEDDKQPNIDLVAMQTQQKKIFGKQKPDLLQEEYQGPTFQLAVRSRPFVTRRDLGDEKSNSKITSSLQNTNADLSALPNLDIGDSAIEADSQSQAPEDSLTVDSREVLSGFAQPFRRLRSSSAPSHFTCTTEMRDSSTFDQQSRLTRSPAILDFHAFLLERELSLQHIEMGSIDAICMGTQDIDDHPVASVFEDDTDQEDSALVPRPISVTPERGTRKSSPDASSSPLSGDDTLISDSQSSPITASAAENSSPARPQSLNPPDKAESTTSVTAEDVISRRKITFIEPDRPLKKLNPITESEDRCSSQSDLEGDDEAFAPTPPLPSFSSVEPKPSKRRTSGFLNCWSSGPLNGEGVNQPRSTRLTASLFRLGNDVKAIFKREVNVLK